MTNSAGAVQNGLVLRLSVPASGELAAVGPAMATRLARQLGVSATDAAKLGGVITGLSKQVDPSGAADVEFEFHKLDAELKIIARQEGRAAEARVALDA
jgi:hypothetical protein